MDRSTTVLALVRSTGGGYHGALLDGLNREVAAAGGRLVVVQTIDPGDRADVVDRTPDWDLPVAWHQVDGAVTVALGAGRELLERLRAAGTPVVMASHRVEGFSAPVALPNNHGGTVAAVEHLLAHGHRRVGFVGTLGQSDMRERHAAYLATLAAHGLSAEGLVFRTDDTTETGGASAVPAVLDALARDERPTAVMVATDRNALGLMAGLTAAGVDVPRDLAVVAFDNIEPSSFSTPSLSSVNQRFDVVGALAGRLVVAAMRGEDVQPIAYTTAAAQVAARASCGCTPGLLGDADHSASTGSATAALRQDLRDLLRTALAAGRSVPDAALRAAHAQVEALLGEDAEPSVDGLRALVTTLHRHAARPELLHQVASALHELVERSADTDAGSPDADRVTAALWQLRAGAYLRRSERLEADLERQFAIDTALLDVADGDPRRLRWLAATAVRAGTLALWDQDGSLRVVGSYDVTGSAPDATGDVVAVESFPSRALIGRADPGRREACFVVPVRTAERRWGLLAVVAGIDTLSARDTYRHWAALLSTAFEAEELQASVRISEERYAVAARASNDGLWELEVASGRMYSSARCLELLGLADASELTVTRWKEAVHPEDRERVAAKMSSAVDRLGQPVEVEYRVQRADGGWRWVLARGLGVAAPGLPAGPVERIVGSLADISPRKELEEQLRLGALYDPLTGLANRRLFLDRLALAVEQCRRRPGYRYAVVFLDLDGFKLVNDSLGHLVGDELLVVVAERLRSELRAVDTAARLGGDEFAILLSDPVPDEVLAISRRVQEALAEPVVLAGHELAVTASAGIATSESGYTDPEDALRDADIAMYEAKRAERGSSAVFDPEMHARASSRLIARGELRAALTEEQFVVHYQPIVALDGSPLRHFEALVRWQHPTRGLLLPGAFLAAMQDDASIVQLGRWVLDTVCRQVAAWRAATGAPVAVSVNLSHAEFWAEGVTEAVERAMTRHGVPPEALVLEITESVVMDDLERGREVMDGLHRLGVRLHIDDFGTGQSSLHALRTFPVDALKIDGSFIRDLGEGTRTAELVRLIVEIGRVLGLDVIAECVETADQAAWLQEMGCANAQGWLYAKALPGDDAGALLGERLGDRSGEPRHAPGTVLASRAR